MADTTPQPGVAEPPKARITMSTIEGSRFILRYMRPYRWKFLVALVSLLISSLAGLAFPGLTGLLIDVVAGTGRSTGWTLGSLALLVIGVLLTQSIFSYVRTYYLMEVAERSLADLRQNLYDKILRLPMSFFNSSRVGELSSRVSADVGTIHTTITTTMSELIRQTIIMIGGVGLVIYTSPRLTTLILIPIPILVAIAVVFGRAIRKESREVQNLYAQLNTIVEETLQGISIVKGFTSEDRESQRYRTDLQRMITVSLRVARARGAFIAFIIFILFGGITAVIWYGGGLVQEGVLSIGDLTSFILYAAFVGGAMGSFADLYASVQRALGASERIREILIDTPAEPLEKAPERVRIAGEVEFRNVSFSYPTRPDVTVLSDISLRVPTGASLALVGSSGAGKSTIANLLMRFFEPTEGTLLVDGRNAADYPLDGYRSELAVVPQDTTLFGGTIAENIHYGNPEATREQIREAAELANALEFIESFPDGFSTIVGERGVRLSGGQRQRIAIARAILKDPSILILDEATSYLDAESERLVQEALERVMRQRTTFVIAHRLSTIRTADMVAVMRQGRVVEYGAYDELIALGGTFARLVAIQQRVGEDIIDERIAL